MDEILNQTDVAISETSKYIEEYETFIQWLTQAKSDFDEFSDSEQAAFAEAFCQFASYTKEPVSPDTVVDVRGNMREVFREPLLQAILDAIEDITARLGFSLDESILDSFNNEMQSWTRDGLIDAREAYDELDSKVDDLNDPERVHVREKIKNKPHQLLEPETQVLSLIESMTEAGARIREISALFSKYDWLSLKDRHIGPFVRSWLDTSVPVSTDIESTMDAIDESVTALNDRGIPTDDAVSNKINNMTEHPRDTLHENLQELSETLDTLSTQTAPFEYIPDMIEILNGNEPDMLDPGPLLAITERLEEANPSSINQIETVVNETQNMYSDWANNVVDRWQTYRSAVDVLSEYTTIEASDEFIGPDEFTQTLFEKPRDALSDLINISSSLEGHRQTVGEEGGLTDESIQLLFELVEKQGISYNEYSQEAIEELNEVIALQIRIDE